jgi:hypothetical protein
LQEEQKESTLYRDDLRTQVGKLRQKLSDAHERREKEFKELNEKITNLTKSLAEMVVRVEFLEKENMMLRTAQGWHMAITSNDSQADFNSLIRNATTGASATTTPDKNLLTGGTGSVYVIRINNTNGSGENYIKIYDVETPVHGTTEPIFCGGAAASSIVNVYSRTGISIGTALSVACSNETGKGATGGNPAGTMHYSIFGS